jgi:hypothetical protein
MTPDAGRVQGEWLTSRARSTPIWRRSAFRGPRWTARHGPCPLSSRRAPTDTDRRRRLQILSRRCGRPLAMEEPRCILGRNGQENASSVLLSTPNDHHRRSEGALPTTRIAVACCCSAQSLAGGSFNSSQKHRRRESRHGDNLRAADARRCGLEPDSRTPAVSGTSIQRPGAPPTP